MSQLTGEKTRTLEKRKGAAPGELLVDLDVDPYYDSKIVNQSGLNNMVKRFIFRYYWGIAIAGTAVATFLVHKWNGWNAGLIGSVVGTALAFCYFVQKQNLDDLRLFRELFTDFNHRYDEMNEKLEDIRAGNQAIDSEQRQILVRYFNLCAEEYLFYREGFIHQLVWRSWCLGMLYYLKNERIKEIWKIEVSLDSYYGLSEKIIEKDSRLPNNVLR
jgi:hypothetical protein